MPFYSSLFVLFISALFFLNVPQIADNVQKQQGEERERSSPFRVKTEAAMQAKAEAEKAELSRLTSERLKTAEIAAKKSADDKLPLPNGAAQGPILAGKGKDAKKGDAPEDGESIGKSVAGRKKKMKTAPGKTDAQVVEDEKEKEKAAATVELAGILKKGPSTDSILFPPSLLSQRVSLHRRGKNMLT